MADIIQSQHINDPYLRFRWKVEQFPDFTGATQAGESTTLDIAYAEKIDLPHVQLDIVSKFQTGSKIFFPGQHSTEAVTITFYEDLEFTVTKYIESWTRLIVDERGLYGLPKAEGNGYKRTIKVNLLDTAYDEIIMQAWIVNAWPSSVQPINLDYYSSERLSLSVTFAVDRVKYVDYLSNESLSEAFNVVNNLAY